MKNTLLLLLFIIGLPVQASDVAIIPEIEPITVNGLIAGKAVVKIGGRHHIMRIGQTTENVKLVSADQYSAVLAINGQEKRFYLQEAKLEDYSDDFIADASKLNEEQAEVLASNTMVRANSHIIHVKLQQRLDNKAHFRVEYFYNASHGKRSSLQARTFKLGKATGYSSHSHTQLEAGRNLVDIVLMMNDKSPASYFSDSIKFEISGEKLIDGSRSVAAKYIPFEKTWLRETPVAPQTVLGSAVWQTGSQ